MVVLLPFSSYSQDTSTQIEENFEEKSQTQVPKAMMEEA